MHSKIYHSLFLEVRKLHKEWNADRTQMLLKINLENNRFSDEGVLQIECHVFSNIEPVFRHECR